MSRPDGELGTVRLWPRSNPALRRFPNPANPQEFHVTAEPTAADRDRWRKIATIALNLAIRDDLEEAARYVARLNGTNGILVAVIGWIDTYMARVQPDQKPGQRIAIRWLHTPTNPVETADDVSPPMAWAGRLVAARAAGDQEQFFALLRSLPEGSALGDGIMALLHGVATSIGQVDTVRAAEARLA